MKIMLITLSLILCACGGTEYVEEEPYLLDIEICEDQGGTVELFHVMSVDTGESNIEVQCGFDKQRGSAQCKTDNGSSQECPKI